MTTTLQENTSRPWLRVLIGILALVLLGVIAWRFVPADNSNTTTSPTQSDEDREQRSHYWWFDANGQATKATGYNGAVLYDSGNWSDKDQRFKEYGIHSGGFISAYPEDDVAATLATPNKTVKGTALVEVTISTNQFASLATAYNAINKDGRRLKDTVDSPAEVMLEAVLAHHTAKVTIPFKAVNPKTDKNKVVADAYTKGYAPWELVKGTPDFDYDNEYAWDHSCTRYEVKPKNEKVTLAELQKALPLKVDLNINNGSGSHWEGRVYWENTKMPCGVKVVNQRPTSKPTAPPTPSPPPDRPAPKENPELPPSKEVPKDDAPE